jgi:anti-anti-sigma factor
MPGRLFEDMNMQGASKRLPFSAEVVREDDLIIFSLEGDLDVSGAQTLRSQFAANIQDSDKFVVFNMSGVPYINSAGLGAIIGFLRNIQLRDGHLFLMNPQEKVRRVFQIASLEPRMLFVDTIETARKIISGEMSVGKQG